MIITNHQASERHLCHAPFFRDATFPSRTLLLGTHRVLRTAMALHAESLSPGSWHCSEPLSIVARACCRVHPAKRTITTLVIWHVGLFYTPPWLRTLQARCRDSARANHHKAIPDDNHKAVRPVGTVARQLRGRMNSSGVPECDSFTNGLVNMILPDSSKVYCLVCEKIDRGVLWACLERPN